VQQWGGPRQEIRQGDVVRIPPGVKHWHGATATTGLTHIAIQEQLDGKSADWMEKVSDEQYQAGTKTEKLSMLSPEFRPRGNRTLMHVFGASINEDIVGIITFSWIDDFDD
jgi:hypothetical protein